MAIIKYQIKENKTIGTHSFYAQAVSYSTLDIDDLAAEIAESVGISRHAVRLVLERYSEVAMRNVLRGHRVRLGDLVTLYPQISVSVKDSVDEQGNVLTRATADMLSLQNAKSGIGATITQAVQQQFASSVSWKKVGDDGTTDGGTTGGDGTGTGSSTSSSDSSTGGGNTSSGGSSDGGSANL